MARIRDDDNPDACDEAPQAEEKCYTRGQPRDESRIKPAPGVEPVRMYRSLYDGKYDVWRLANCVPARAKRPQTEEQRRASIRLGLLTRMRSERGRFAMLARIWLALDPVFLDTETTGLDAGAQALKIGLMNARGERIFGTRLKPIVVIDPAAVAIHDISDKGLVRAPSWPDIAQQLQHHIGRRPLVISNAELDTRVLR